MRRPVPESMSRPEPDALEAQVQLARWTRQDVAVGEDLVAHEEPLELQLQGISLAVVMRTPGHDEELALGFLLSEGVIHSVDDVVSVYHCTEASGEARDNVVRVLLRAGVSFDAERHRRTLFTSSSCGLCGKASIDAVMQVAPPLPLDGPALGADRLYRWPERLRQEQPTFTATGGLHAAGLFDRLDRVPPLVREDVGRHNAVDKVLGAMLRHRRPGGESILLVSGRIGFELVQKAAAARVPILAGLSAPTSLAIRAAEALHLTVVGFLRGQQMNVYSHPERITSERATASSADRR
jgi:FdhD protein